MIKLILQGIVVAILSIAAIGGIAIGIVTLLNYNLVLGLIVCGIILVACLTASWVKFMIDYEKEHPEYVYDPHAKRK